MAKKSLSQSWYYYVALCCCWLLPSFVVQVADPPTLFYSLLLPSHQESLLALTRILVSRFRLYGWLQSTAGQDSTLASCKKSRSLFSNWSLAANRSSRSTCSCCCCCCLGLSLALSFDSTTSSPFWETLIWTFAELSIGSSWLSLTAAAASHSPWRRWHLLPLSPFIVDGRTKVFRLFTTTRPERIKYFIVTGLADWKSGNVFG